MSSHHDGAPLQAISALRLRHGAKASVGELKEVTSTTEKAVEMAINVISVLGETGTNKTTKYQLTADKTAYRQAAIEVAEKTNNNFIQKMIDLQ